MKYKTFVCPHHFERNGVNRMNGDVPGCTRQNISVYISLMVTHTCTFRPTPDVYTVYSIRV